MSRICHGKPVRNLFREYRAALGKGRFCLDTCLGHDPKPQEVSVMSRAWARLRGNPCEYQRIFDVR
jgi:hypothetical protein